ncbi:MAG: glycosyltransferase family 39 protein [Actinomycetota bacterium]|nr:glycosyltransferase family 39 protein [Actinomycetota bacterium]
MKTKKVMVKKKDETTVNIAKYGYELALAIVIIIAAIALCYGISDPWRKGHEGTNGAYYSTIARNYLIYGLKTKLAQVQNPYIVSPKDFGFYADHPPLMPLTVALFFMVFGEHEWSARLVPILCSLFSLWLIFLIGKDLWNKRVGLIASAAFSANAMFLWYGHHVNHEAPTIFFGLLIILSYIRWIRGDVRYFWILCVSIFLGGLTDWPTYYLIPILGLHYFIFAKPRKLIAIVPVAVSIATLGLIFLQIRLMGPNYFKILVDQFFFRVNLSAVDTSKVITFKDLLVTLYQRALTLFTIPLLISSIAGLFISLTKRFGKERFFSFSILLGLFAYAWIHILLFKNGAYIHSYWMHYMLPALGLSAGIALDFVASFLPKQLNLVPALIVIAIMAFLTKPTLSNIYNAYDYSYYNLGTAIASISNPGDTILVSFPGINNPQVAYYARRNIIENINSLAAFNQALKDHPSSAVMISLKNGTDPGLLNFLNGRYPHQEPGNIIIYKLQ